MSDAVITVLNLLIVGFVIFGLVIMKSSNRRRRSRKLNSERAIVTYVDQKPEGIIVRSKLAGDDTLKHSIGGKDVYYQTIWADYSSGKISRETTVELLRRK